MYDSLLSAFAAPSGMTIQRIDFLGLPLDTGIGAEDVCRLMLDKSQLRLVTFLNPQAWALAKRYPGYLPALQQMNMLLPDGEGVARACREITGLPCPRLSFDTTSLADPMFRIAIAIKYSLMLIGGRPGVDEMVQEKLQQKYPEIDIRGTSHGYDDFEPKIKLVMANMPDMVVVGMGAPRQEEFLLALRAAGYRGLAITCGGFFDQYLEADDYYPKWIDKFNLRFAWRLYREPQRLWRRYLIDYQVFVWRALTALADKHMPGWIKDRFVKKSAN